MSDFPGGAEVAAEIRAAFAVPVIYAGAGLAQPTTVQAVKADVAAPSFDGMGATARTIAFEIGKADLPGNPGKSDTITEGVIVWRVIEIVDRSDVAAWQLVVEV